MSNRLSFIKKFKDIDKQLLVSTILLLLIGTLSIVSASSRETVSRYDYSVYHYFFRQLVMIFAGLVGTIFIFFFPTKYYKKFAYILYGIVSFFLIYIFIYGKVKRGSNNWIEIFGFTFQPSEFAKPIVVMTLAIIFERFSKILPSGNKNVRLIFFAMWAFFGLFFPAIVFLQGDLGTSLILGGIAFVMFISSPLDEKYKWRYSGILMVALALALLLIYCTKGYVLTEEQKSRLDFFNPCSRYEDSGYQVCNALIAINNGGLAGLGIGKSQQKYSYIPEPHTDSIFAIIVEEKGLFLGIIIIFLYVWMLRRIYHIARCASTIRGRYIAYGAFVYLFLHILLNLGGLLAVLPLTGVPLPLISYGGSFTISFICMLSMVQLVNVETKNEKIKITR